MTVTLFACGRAALARSAKGLWVYGEANFAKQS